MSQFKHFTDDYAVLRRDSTVWTLEKNIERLIAKFIEENKDMSIIELRLLSGWLNDIFSHPFCMEICHRRMDARKKLMREPRE